MPHALAALSPMSTFSTPHSLACPVPRHFWWTHSSAWCLSSLLRRLLLQAAPLQLQLQVLDQEAVAWRGEPEPLEVVQ